jgi:uncharacterized protein (TIGR00661 family)
MKRIFYGVAGEGLGHFSRCLSLIQALPEYEIHVFTFGEAYAGFKRINYPFLHKIDGISWGRNKNGIIKPIKSLINFTTFWLQSYDRHAKAVWRKAKELKPVAIITDFEPILARLKRKCRVPLISIDNQHKFSHCTIHGVPLRLKLYCWITGIFVRAYIPVPNHIIISTFHHDQVKKLNAKLVNGFIRQEIIQEPRIEEDFVLVYAKHSIFPKLLECLPNNRFHFKIYGLNQPGPNIKFNGGGGHEYCHTSSANFARDLVRCKAVICTAGNQLLSEAVYLKKKILTIPEPNQTEQAINGFYLERGGLGINCDVKYLTRELIVGFINNFSPKEYGSDTGVQVTANYIRELI